MEPLKRKAAYIGLPLAVAMAAVASAWAILPACGLSGLPWTEHCPPTREPRAEGRLDHLAARRAALEAEVAALQRRVAALPICERPPPAAEPESPPPPLARQEPPAPPPPQPDIRQDQWDRRDVSLLEGCWDLDSNFETVQPGNVRHPVRSWSMCFDANGQGRQEFRAFRDQRPCSGGVRGQFSGTGDLNINFTENARCRPGGEIIRRNATCTLRPDGRAACTSIRQSDRLRQTFVLRRRQ
ncbi:MAG: hypothetical protein EA406_00865 [Rhodospirillales bacterium]|nr:MAG: hypothetical protein EA406_00865 [Rhodospirillales bacterium]